jgi:hypothetical protein
MDYNPRPQAAALLDAAYGFVQSVPYQVSARWLFYRLLQDSWVSTKADYKKVISLLSKARKSFWKDWRPDTLADETRAVDGVGHGYQDLAEWLKAVASSQVFSYVDRWQAQPSYVVVCFEAKAMASQFDHYLPAWVPQVAFGGDVSIPAKWKIAELFGWAHRRYDKPLRMVYFGDLDDKGLLIPESARRDIEEWLPVGAFKDFEYERAGLNPGDEDTYNIAENPERPGTYQWEALDDDTAGELITGAVEPHLDIAAGDACEEKDDRRMTAFREWWGDHKPTADDLGLDEDD